MHMVGEDEQIVREAEGPEGSDTSLEVVAEEEPRVRLIDDDVAEALHLGVDRQDLEPGGHVWCTQIDPTHDSFDAGVRPR